jgi:hypothetical protein
MEVQQIEKKVEETKTEQTSNQQLGQQHARSLLEIIWIVRVGEQRKLLGIPDRWYPVD